MKLIKRMLYVIGLFLIGPILVVACGKVNLSQDWRNADRSSQHIAPTPQQESEAVIQAYAARAFSWRGIFAVHTWIATKPKGARSYTVHQVVGWREWQQQRVVVSHEDVAREVPELNLELPTTAIGKDYLVNGGFFDSAPSGTGWQFSLYGVFGLTLARDEGLELNLLSANFAIDPLDLSIKLPGIGRLGF
jgi:hypothetical protein